MGGSLGARRGLPLACPFLRRDAWGGLARKRDMSSAYTLLPLRFLLGEDPNFRKEMPVLVLVDGIMDHCHKAGFAILDIGVSTEKSMPNEGLIAFKTGLGFQSSPKLTFRYAFR